MKFVSGIIFAVVAFIVAVAIYTGAGYMPVNADIKPGKIETYLATHAFDKSVERQAPKVKNPLQPTEEVLSRGMVSYTMNCALCHGSPAKKGPTIGESAYPPAPQFTEDAPDRPDYENFWIVKHGVRYTAMPAWGKMMNDDEIWALATFLGHWNNLPPALKNKFQGGQ
jgi:mono/diheme cytochrome c family protein